MSKVKNTRTSNPNNKEAGHRSDTQYYSGSISLIKKKVYIDLYNNDEFVETKEILAPAHAGKLSCNFLVPNNITHAILYCTPDEELGRKRVKPGVNMIIIKDE